MTDLGADLAAAAREWLASDPDPDTRAELEAVLAADDAAGLSERFGSRLQFGTAGLRGALGAGPNRMNRALVRRAAAGLAAWLHAAHPDRVGDGVAVGFDARHKSYVFAEDTCRVLAGAGIPTHLLPGPCPTPVLAYAIGRLGAAAGVMVTASHNPPQDNGYKVYDHSGAQIVPPTDTEISAAIDAVGPLEDVLLGELDGPLVHRLGGAITDAYLDAVLAMLEPKDGPGAGAGAGPSERRPVVVYSAMHGVGGATVVELLERAGFGRPELVAEQFEPDADFPTVSFPNPEEPGAMDLSLAAAARVGADLVVVNDPDADRLAVAIPSPDTEGGWRMLRGDEVGVLLADAVLTRPPVLPDAVGRPVLACSLVSSQQLGRMAAAAGVDFEETLTGFKWIARSPGPDRHLLFGYEEALGYCVGDIVRDKDGMSALLALVRRVAELGGSGAALQDRLDALSREHGLHVTRQRSFRADGLDGLERIAAAMRRLRTESPHEVAGRAVLRLEDLSVPQPGRELPPGDVVVLHLDGARVIVRPSGTEPKLKCYLEVVVPVGDDLAAARATANAALDAIDAAMTEVLALP
ncbi:MAG: phospho-sugar mutase [Acidimicrobiia bacterium]|nr:phospho-sugar mutase [Acidimicrobiia bacterium]